jgi:ATP synthase protein I
MDHKDTAFVMKVAAKAARKQKAQHEKLHPVWSGLGIFGLVGWSVALPTLLGALLGLWWDRRHPGLHSWTLALLVAGLLIGCANAWYWVSREDQAISDESDDNHG